MAVTGASALLSTSTSATWFLYPLFLSDVWDYSNLEIGLAMTPGPISLVLFAPWSMAAVMSISPILLWWSYRPAETDEPSADQTVSTSASGT